MTVSYAATAWKAGCFLVAMTAFAGLSGPVGAMSVRAEHGAEPAADAPAAIPGETGILQTAAGIYEFKATSCAVYAADDDHDIEIRGPGTAPDGGVFYFELTSTGNAIVLELGVDKPFESMDQQIKAGQFYSKPFTITVEDRLITVTDLALVDGNGAALDPDARLQINCAT